MESKGSTVTSVSGQHVKWKHCRLVQEHFRQEEVQGSGWQKKKPKDSTRRGHHEIWDSADRSSEAHYCRARAVIINRVPYVAHNQGAEFEQSIPITPKMRRWAWYMYYKNSGGKLRKGQKRTGNPLVGQIQGFGTDQEESDQQTRQHTEKDRSSMRTRSLRRCCVRG